MNPARNDLESSLADGITGVLLNWMRPDNVARILNAWQAGGIVREAIVWNNNAEAPLCHEWARVVTAGEDFGMYTRFAAACLARTECVLLQDDDLQVPPGALQLLYDAWKADPEVLHGVFGRAPNPDGSYGQDVLGDCEAPIVLTRVLLARRAYAARFFLHVPHFARVQRRSRPPGNGEDIIFSYTAMRYSGRPNRVHRAAVEELPAPHPIHGRNWHAHVRHRSRLLRACQAWLPVHPERPGPGPSRPFQDRRFRPRRSAPARPASGVGRSNVQEDRLTVARAVTQRGRDRGGMTSP